jgi:hypothetical protein
MEKYPSFIHTLSDKHGFTRSAKYEQAWMFDHSMGPNPLWLTEWPRYQIQGFAFSANLFFLFLKPVIINPLSPWSYRSPGLPFPG